MFFVFRKEQVRLYVSMILRAKHTKKFWEHWAAAGATLFLALSLGACFHVPCGSQTPFICIFKEDAMCWKHFNKEVTSWRLAAWWVKSRWRICSCSGFNTGATGFYSWGIRFESRPGYRLYWFFRFFSVSPSEIQDITSKKSRPSACTFVPFSVYICLPVLFDAIFLLQFKERCYLT